MCFLLLVYFIVDVNKKKDTGPSRRVGTNDDDDDDDLIIIIKCQQVPRRTERDAPLVEVGTTAAPLVDAQDNYFCNRTHFLSYTAHRAQDRPFEARIGQTKAFKSRQKYSCSSPPNPKAIVALISS